MSISARSDDAILQALGERLRRLRLDADLTRRELAARCGLSADTLRNAEAGRNVSLESLLRILRALGELERFSTLLEDAGPSPVELAHRQGKLRQRASGRRRARKRDRQQ